MFNNRFHQFNFCYMICYIPIIYFNFIVYTFISNFNTISIKPSRKYFFLLGLPLYHIFFGSYFHKNNDVSKASHQNNLNLKHLKILLLILLNLNNLIKKVLSIFVYNKHQFIFQSFLLQYLAFFFYLHIQ